MKQGRRRLPDGLRAPMLAGWLFADLLLVLFVTAFISLPAPTLPSSHHSHPKPTPSPTQKPRVLEQKPRTIKITNVSPANVASPDSATRASAVAKLLRELRKKLAAEGLRGQPAGFVIVLAYGPIDGIDQAVSTADSVVHILKAKESQFSGVAGLGYWSGSPGFDFKIFFFA